MPSILIAGRPHSAGDKGCEACWDTYPDPCWKADCKGLMHAHFLHMRGDKPIIEGGCDACGATPQIG